MLFLEASVIGQKSAELAGRKPVELAGSDMMTSLGLKSPKTRTRSITDHPSAGFGAGLCEHCRERGTVTAARFPWPKLILGMAIH